MSTTLRRLLHIGIMALLFTMLLSLPINTAAQEDVHVFITGPDTLPTNTTAQYTIRITGGPADVEGANGTFRFIGHLDMPDPLGAVMDPQDGVSDKKTFYVNITTPNNPQDMTMVINGTSTTNVTNMNETMWSGDVSKAISVFEPYRVNITAVVKNPSPADVRDAKVTFYVDDELIGNKTVNLDANSTETVSIEWVAPPEEKGLHTVEVRVNDDGSILEFNTGDNVMTKTIYVGKRPERPVSPIMAFSNGGLIFVLMFFAFVFFLVTVFMWWRTRRGRAYYTPAQNNFIFVEGILMIFFSMPMFYVADVLFTDSDATGDPVATAASATVLFALGFLTVLFTWLRAKRKKR
jgi:hypothetical protein